MIRWYLQLLVLLLFQQASSSTPLRPLSPSPQLITPLNSQLSVLNSHLSPYRLHRTHDSLYHLNDFRLPYPVYRFCTGDVDGDGTTDALVGVIKNTRFHREKGRRIFIFKQVDGKPRPLWMGSKLGGILQDFRYLPPADSTLTRKGTIRSLETTIDHRYVVAEYQWEGFGLAFQRFLIKNTDKETALKKLNE